MTRQENEKALRAWLAKQPQKPKPKPKTKDK